MVQDDWEKIKMMHDALRKINEFTKGMRHVDELTSNQLVWDAVKLNLIVIYESDLKLSGEFKGRFKQVEWSKIQAYQPDVMNLYLGFNKEVIWKIIQEEVPVFIKKIELLLSNG
jgi:uncharacterized protein with HEPN domain